MITQEIKRNRTRPPTGLKRKFERQSGGRFGFIIEPTYHYTITKESNFSSIGIGLVPHYRHGQTVFIGLAIGLRHPCDTERFLLPLLLDFRVRGKSRIAPMGAAGMGCMFIHDRFVGTLGVSFNLKAGVSISGVSGRSFDILLGFDNSEQRYDKERASYSGPRFKDTALNSFSLSVGVTL